MVHGIRTSIAWLGFTALLVTAAAEEREGRRGGFKAEQRSDRLVITQGGRPLTHYVFADNEVLRPYFAHVRAPDGMPATRSHPPVEGVDAVDHAAMHPGIWLGFGDINGQDFWRNKGTIRHDRFTSLPRSSDRGLEFATSSTLVAADGTAIGRVDSHLALRMHGDGFLLWWTAIFKAIDGELTFGDQEEMGFGVRVATPLTEKSGGTVRNAEGVTGAARAWGKTADWCDYSGIVNGRRVGVAVLVDTANFRPSWIHCRDYGLVVANPFGRMAFTGIGEPSRIVVPTGQSLRLQFGAYVYSVPSNQAPDIASVQRTFAAGEDGPFGHSLP